MSVGAPAVARSRTIALIGAVLIGVALLAFVLTHEGDRSLTETLTTFASGLSEQGATGALLFALGYAVAVVAFFPASVLTLLAGALFGFAKGAALVFVGAVLGSTIAFLLSRSVLRAGVGGSSFSFASRRCFPSPRSITHSVSRAFDSAIT